MMSQVSGHHLAYPYSQPIHYATLKQSPGDFVVTEIPGFELSGSGEHVYFYIEKTGLTTNQLIGQIARQLNVPSRNIGYAGLKDKQAVTRQWISIQLPGKQTPALPDADEYRILDCNRHHKKLRIGSHQGNYFKVVLRGVEDGFEVVQDKLELIRQQGFANYFGAQRFGRNQDNVEQAIAALSDSRKARRLKRQRKSLMISSLRSFLFNRLLDCRIAQGIWVDPVDGDVFQLAGSHSVFNQMLDQTLMDRYHRFDLHCALPLHGTKGSILSTGDAQQIEAGVFVEYPEISEILDRLAVKLGYRSNRAVARGLKITTDKSEQTIELEVELEPGVFLTTLLDHLLLLRQD